MQILALDPATKCGFAHSDGYSGTWDLSVRRDESCGMRLLRLGAKLAEVKCTIGVDLVVFEAARHAGPKMQGALVVQSELQGQIKAWATAHKIDYRGYSPSEIKKRATGKGNGKKDAVFAAAVEKWGGAVVKDDNQADALWLLDLARSEYDA